MKWSDTVANDCRYGDVAALVWGDCDIVWEDSEADYQGHASIVARHPDGTFSFYEWQYGSCSGCDYWEGCELSDAEIEAEMRKDAVYFATAAEAEAYFALGKEQEGYSSRRFAAACAAIAARRAAEASAEREGERE